MALVWAEPFDQYGTTTALMANNGYANAPIGSLQAFGRTGADCLQVNSSGYLERALSTAVVNLGMGWAVNPVAGSGSTNDFNTDGCRWYSGAFTNEFTIGCMPDLGIGVYKNTTLIGRTAANLLTSSSYTWVEALVSGNTGGASTGHVEVRIQGVQQLVINNVDVPNIFTGHGIGGFWAGNCRFDDWIVWNTLGTSNNTFMGDRRLVLCMPNANGALQDFTPSAGSAFNCVNLIPPVDTTFISGAAAGNISEFAKSAVGLNSTDIAAVVVSGRLFKSDAGAATAILGINSAANVLNSPAINPGTTGAWSNFIVELDPNGNIPWTRAAVDAANIRITRTA